MQRTWPWVVLVVLLVGLLMVREPRLQRAEDIFLHWLLKHTQPKGGPVPLTVVEIGSDPLLPPGEAPPPQNSRVPGPVSISPLEFALFLQAVLEFNPDVIAFENILRWRERDKDQEQVFLDQAMKVPKLLLGAELAESGDPDAVGPEVRAFTNVTGRRGNLPEYSVVGRHAADDLRLIAAQGFTNLPDGVASKVRVPLLFLYRGEVIPSFALQAVLLWMRLTPSEVKVRLGSSIELGENRRIPIQADGTMYVHPEAAARARRLGLNDLLLETQEKGKQGAEPLDLSGQVVLARTPANPLAPPDVFAATIATIQGNMYLRRVAPLFDYVFVVIVALLAGIAGRMDKTDLILCGIALSAGYCLIALAAVSRMNLWMPGILPLGLMWLVIAGVVLFRRGAGGGRSVTITIPPPVP